jgi:MEDS: MEthanogen/methylotroph, DcmR Sensory domain
LNTKVADDLIALGWGDRRLAVHSHVAFYFVDEEAMRSCLAFLRLGLDEQGTFSILLADAARHQQLLAELQMGYAGDVERACEEGRLVTIGLVPDFDEMGALVRRTLDAVMAAGYRLVRILGLVGWGLPQYPDADWLRRCEAQVNRVVREYPVVVVCLYDVPSFADPLAGGREWCADPVIVTHSARGGRPPLPEPPL